MTADLDGCRHVSRLVQAPRWAVWHALSDGWAYATWVVGASRVRSVDPTWPAEGARVAHSFGVWPLVVDDESRVVRSRPGHALRVRAAGWPLGEAEVALTLTDQVRGATVVTMVEDAVAGPGTAVPHVVRQAAIAARNGEALRRLALVVEGRHHAPAAEGPR